MLGAFYTSLTLALGAIGCGIGLAPIGGGSTTSSPPKPAPLLGQTSPTASTSGTSATTLNLPIGVVSDGHRWVVVDQGNNRVLIWNSLPTVAGQAADLVLGQPDTTSNAANNGGTAAGTLSNPSQAAIYGNKLLVADSGNSRILIWNTFPTVSQQPANVAIGQTVFTASGVGTSATQFFSPTAIAVDPNGLLYVADTSNNRVLYFSTIPTANGAAATQVIGQGSFATGGSGTTSATLNIPSGVAADTSFVYVTDRANNRVMIFGAAPASPGLAASNVLGQASFGPVAAACTSTGMSGPAGAFLKGGRLYVAEASNHRVLSWNNAVGVSIGQAADAVFGQTNFATCPPNAGGIGQLTLNTPIQIFVDPGNYLWVADSANNRVTINLLP